MVISLIPKPEVNFDFAAFSFHVPANGFWAEISVVEDTHRTAKTVTALRT
jgi:hypothetical protein